MKIINNIEDLRRIYRNKDLLEINEMQGKYILYYWEIKIISIYYKKD